MACALTQGYSLDCKDSLGGITEVYFMAFQDVASYTVSGGVGTFTLQLPMPKNIVTGNSFRAIRGCDRRFDTCKNVFNNVNNFRGYPHLPGLDEMLKSGV